MVRLTLFIIICKFIAKKRLSPSFAAVIKVVRLLVRHVRASGRRQKGVRPFQWQSKRRLPVSVTTAAGFAVPRAVYFFRAGGGINRAAVILSGFFPAGRAFYFFVVLFNVFLENFAAFRAFVFKKKHKFLRLNLMPDKNNTNRVLVWHTFMIRFFAVFVKRCPGLFGGVCRRLFRR